MVEIEDATPPCWNFGYSWMLKVCGFGYFRILVKLSQPGSSGCDPLSGFIRDLFRGDFRDGSIWLINPGHGWKNYQKSCFAHPQISKMLFRFHIKKTVV